MTSQNTITPLKGDCQNCRVIMDDNGLASCLFESIQCLLASPQQKNALLNLVEAGDHETKMRLIAHNLHLVVDIAKRYRDHGVSFFVLVREGIAGLNSCYGEFQDRRRISFCGIRITVCPPKY